MLIIEQILCAPSVHLRPAIAFAIANIANPVKEIELRIFNFISVYRNNILTKLLYLVVSVMSELQHYLFPVFSLFLKLSFHSKLLVIIFDRIALC